MTLALARAHDALALVDEVVAARLSPANEPADRVDVSDLLLAELFDERRTYEIVCERVAATLDGAHLGTLGWFLA